MSSNYCLTALLAFEHTITFGSEVELFWKQKWTGSSIIFLLNRYLVLLYNCLNIPFITTGYVHIGLAVSIFNNCLVLSVLLTMRSYCRGITIKASGVLMLIVTSTSCAPYNFFQETVANLYYIPWAGEFEAIKLASSS